ncbi:MAG: type 4a pilus biogenesis protein PilO [Candidatus Omnitrophica bacterium]|nr:type 4a pilus biogenesis protein PilO [Candidatus Omnitrophota bacterium]MDD5236232.1 type 4a pilus biogenesis protein PilO [Candidatus Omnitrophota bacterium]MDD5611114.1 type 4a pilus biogenesis protein PilO [Candidatus Omnitrophota bacterium]
MPKKNLIANVIVLIIIILVIVWVYNFQIKNYNGLQAQKENEIKKNTVIESISGLEKTMLAYKKLLFKKEINSLVTIINNIAAEDKIKIQSMQPLPEENKQYYTQLSINLAVNVASYHALGNFVKDLEKSPDIFNIDVISVVSAKSGDSEAINASTAGELNATLKVSTYIYKE